MNAPMSSFSPEAFLGAQYDQGIDTRIPLHRAGEWSGYVGTGEKDVFPRQITIQKGDRAGQQATIVDVYFYADDPAAVGEGGQPPARCRASFFIDYTANGALDFSTGKNRQLGNLLTALGFQDKTGKSLKPWSWRMFPGMRVKYKVEHKPREGDSSQVDANVTAFLPA